MSSRCLCVIAQHLFEGGFERSQRVVGASIHEKPRPADQIMAGLARVSKVQQLFDQVLRSFPWRVGVGLDGGFDVPIRRHADQAIVRGLQPDLDRVTVQIERSEPLVDPEPARLRMSACCRSFQFRQGIVANPAKEKSRHGGVASAQSLLPITCLGAVFFGEEDVVVGVGVEGRVEIDEIDGFVIDVAAEDVQVCRRNRGCWAVPACAQVAWMRL